MKIISDYSVAILFYLLQGGTLRIPYEANKIPLSELLRKFDKLGRIVARKPSKIFETNIRNGIYKLSLIAEQKPTLIEFLDRYYTELVAGIIKGNTTKVQWKAAREKFIKGLEEANYNLNDFHTSNIENMHLLFPELIEGDYDLQIKIDKCNTPQSLEDKSTLDNFYKNFKFNCTADINGAHKRLERTKNILLSKVEPVRVDMLENTSNVIVEKISQKQTQQDLMLEEIDKLVKNRGKGGEITLKELGNIYKDMTKNKNRSISNNISKRIQNYVSAYRTTKATTLTLGRMNTYPEEFYFIKEKNF